MKLNYVLNSMMKTKEENIMNPTKKQIEVIEKMIQEFSLVHSREKRLEVLAWYDLASGIKNIEVTRKIMIDLNAI